VSIMVSYSFLFNMMIHSSPVWAEKKETTAIGTAPVYMCNCIRGGGGLRDARERFPSVSCWSGGAGKHHLNFKPCFGTQCFK
jgi:hypothetical protein